jgi:putative 4-mercaptohistidine N1-methyltranferase
MSTPFYDSDAALEQYLLFHYGTPEQICPLLPEMHAACGFPARCVTESLDRMTLPDRGRALDLGCAVGRSSMELERTFAEVVGIDFSARFVVAASEMRLRRRASVWAPREGPAGDELDLKLPPDLLANRVRFEQGDACDLRADLGKFNLVLMANLIDRLPDPARCLARIPDLLLPSGWLIITSPYTWMEEYTPREKWLAGEDRGTLAALQELLAPSFHFESAFDLPFLIREHRRKFQWSLAEVSLWRLRETEGP